MLRILTAVSAVLFMLGSVGSQTLKRDGSLQNMLEYNAQFGHDLSFKQPPVLTQPQHEVVKKQQSDVEEDDPFVKMLFKEFLLQYKHLAAGQPSSEVPITIDTTTTTTTEIPNEVNYVITSQNPDIVTATPEVLTIPQKRRLQPPKRKSEVQSRERIHQNLEDASTVFPSLRQKYFGVDTHKPMKPIPTFTLANIPTTSTPIITEEDPATSQTSRAAPTHIKIPQKILNFSPKPPAVPQKVEATTKKATKPVFDEEEFKRQAQNAKYEFASDIEDDINGNFHQREEVRDGLSVRGKYSYSDGYFKRTVYYEADDKGYRVVRQEVQPLNGPFSNPDGQARISSYVAGNTLNYHITKDDIVNKNRKTLFSTIEVPSDKDAEDEVN